MTTDLDTTYWHVKLQCKRYKHSAVISHYTKRVEGKRMRRMLSKQTLMLS